MAISVPINPAGRRGTRGPNRLNVDRLASRPDWAISLTQARVAAGLTLVAADSLAGISFTTLSHYERGTRTPSAARLARLMDLYAKAAQR